VFDEEGDTAFRFTFDARWFPGVHAGTLRWEDLLLSRRVNCWRDPDVYNNHLFGLLKFAQVDSLEAVERYETSLQNDASILVQTEDALYQVQRFCPHAGNDLLMTGQVLEGGKLRCVAHRYEFDLESGICVNGSCPSLRSTRLPERAIVGASADELPTISA
jgi:UDP-MurNAc hydroxylase